jgi:hypothetical protein
MKRSPLLMFQMWTCSFSADVGGIQQVFVNGAGALVVELTVRDAGAVDLGFEQGSEHGYWRVKTKTGGQMCTIQDQPQTRRRVVYGTAWRVF